MKGPVKFFSSKTRKNKPRGQSLVEFALTLPLLLLLLSGLVEFGFMLNEYLSLVDGSREVARLFSNFDPIADNAFYDHAANQVQSVLEPKDANDTTRKISFRNDTDHPDDIIISVFSVSGGTATLLPVDTSDAKYVGNANPYHWSNNQVSRLDEAEITSRLDGSAPNTGILTVEIFYHYDQVLKLPWLKAIPDPVLLHAYTIMPLSSAEPTSTPIPPPIP